MSLEISYQNIFSFQAIQGRFDFPFVANNLKSKIIYLNCCKLKYIGNNYPIPKRINGYIRKLTIFWNISSDNVVLFKIANVGSYTQGQIAGNLATLIYRFLSSRKTA
jgi:hypothetical protein